MTRGRSLRSCPSRVPARLSRRAVGDILPGVRAFLVGVALVSLVAGCSGGAVAGGAEDLPGPVPEGVSFASPPPAAPPAPDFTAELLDGTTVTASDLWAERPLILVFTASWCETCAAQHRAAAEVVGEHGGAVALLGVVPHDDAEDAQAYADDLGLGYPVAVADEQVWRSYAALEPPLVAVVARGGHVVRGWPGGVDRDLLADTVDDMVIPAGGG